MHLYLHVPFCESKCDYCAFYSVTTAAAAARAAYPGLALREWDLLDTEPGSIETLYVGGGTPGLLGTEGFRRLADGLRARGRLADAAEWTVELNPASAGAPLLAALRAAGVNRLSFGAQCFDDAILRRLGRRHTAAATRQALERARQAGFVNLGIDLIAGLPGMTPAGWRETLRQALDLGCAHLSVYGLGVEPGTRLQAAVRAGLAVPDADEQMDALAAAEPLLAAGGLARYEISNFARPGMACRHNLAVWRGEDYLGLGPAAASRRGRRRWTNLADLPAYAAAVQAGRVPPRAAEDALDAAADALERFVFGARLGEGISPAAAARAWPVLAPRVAAWEARLARLAAQGITESVPDGGDPRWRLTARGREVADAVIRDLL